MCLLKIYINLLKLKFHFTTVATAQLQCCWVAVDSSSDCKCSSHEVLLDSISQTQIHTESVDDTKLSVIKVAQQIGRKNWLRKQLGQSALSGQRGGRKGVKANCRSHSLF